MFKLYNKNCINISIKVRTVKLKYPVHGNWARIVRN